MTEPATLSVGLDPSLPDVTVIIPTRGTRAVLLERAARSVLDNGYPGRLSVLVIADGVDPALVRLQVPAGVAVLGNERTPGLAGARNSGLQAVTSEVVAFCDDDDEWLAGKLVRQIQLLQVRPDALLVGCGITVVQEGRQTGRRSPATVSYDDLLRDRVMALHSSTLVMRRQDILDRIGLLDEQLPGGFGEDYDLLLRVAKQVDVLAVPEPYVLVHWHGSSYYFSHWATIAAALTYLLGKHPDFARSRHGQARLEAQTALALAASGQRGPALRLAGRAFLRWPLEVRVLLAVAVALHRDSAEVFQALAHRVGRGL